MMGRVRMGILMRTFAAHVEHLVMLYLFDDDSAAACSVCGWICRYAYRGRKFFPFDMEMTIWIESRCTSQDQVL